MKLRKRFFKKLTYKWAVRNVGLFFGRNVLNTLVAECNSVTLVSCMRAVGLRATTSRHLDGNFVTREEFHWRFLLSEVGFLVNILQLSFVYKVCTVSMTYWLELYFLGTILDKLWSRPRTARHYTWWLVIQLTMMSTKLVFVHSRP